MLQFDEQQGCRNAQSDIDRILARLNWDDLNLVRTIFDNPSIRKAAAFSGFSPNTVRARLQRVENRAGTIFFVRDSRGLTPTPEGLLAAELAKRMGKIGKELPLGLGNRSVVRGGELRIRVTEGVGSIWLTPMIGKLRETVPYLTLVLDCDAQHEADDLSDYDLAIGYQRPTDNDMIVTRLATVHVMPFASKAYLDRHGTPTSIDDLVSHSLIHQVIPGVEHDAIRLFLGEDLASRLVALRVSSSYALFGAIASSLGIGAMPTYMRAVYDGVIPLDISINMRFPLWLSYRAAARDSKPLRSAITWLRACFDAKSCPWFRERFVHPNEFGKRNVGRIDLRAFDETIDALG